MKKTFRRTISLVLAFVLVFSMPICSFAAENDDPYLEVRAAIYSQLEAQNALHLYDHFCSILIPEAQASSAPARAANGPWNAPNGGILQYTYDYTYRGEDGYVSNVIYYMDVTATTQYLSSNNSLTGANFVRDILNKINFPFTFMFDYVIRSAQITNAASRASIAAAGGRAKVATVYDSISGTNSTVAVGWDTYSTIPAPRSDAYDIRFDFN